MTGFFRQGTTLVCDGVPLGALADANGTPLYVFSAAVVTERYRALDAAFAGYPHTIHYALKANSTLAVARLFRALGSGVDANSGGEIEVARRAGFTPDQIVFSGVGKTVAELSRAVDLGLRSVNVESAGELERLDALACERGRRVPVALRVNPDIDAHSHPHISTGLRTNKFGIPLEDVRPLAARMRGRQGIAITGLHIHVGSQITDLSPLRRAAAAIVRLACELRDEGTPIEHLDLGGGLGVSYDGSSVPEAPEYAEALLSAVRGSGLSILLEPGRQLVAPAGVLLTRVVDLKPQGAGRQFVVVDAGMTELIRPMLYGAFHRIEPVEQTTAATMTGDVVGPLCESSDTLGRDRTLPLPSIGDVYAVFDTGAYGSVMASNYNRRLMPAEVMVENGQAGVMRRRQTLDDLLALET